VDRTVDSDSELCTVPSSRFSGLEEDRWKENHSDGGDVIATATMTALETANGTAMGTAMGTATGTVTVVRTRPKSKRVHWE
jgi:hypothetical protein